MLVFRVVFLLRIQLFVIESKCIVVQKVELYNDLQPYFDNTFGGE